MKGLMDLVNALKTFASELKARANKSLQALPPLEQIEAAGPVRCVLQDALWMAEALTDLNSRVESLAARIPVEEQEVRAEVLREVSASPDFLAKADHEALLATAREAGRQEAETQFESAKLLAETARTRRAELEAKLGATVAGAVAEEALLSEDWPTKHLAALTGRVEKMKAAGLDEEKTAKGFRQLAALPLDEAGEAQFALTLEAHAEILASPGPAGTLAPKASAGGKVIPMTPPLQGAAKGKVKALVC